MERSRHTRHDDNQIVYAGRGVLAVTTSAGSWISPNTRAIWVPAGTVHAHRAYGELELHTVGIPPQRTHSECPCPPSSPSARCCAN